MPASCAPHRHRDVFSSKLAGHCRGQHKWTCARQTLGHKGVFVAVAEELLEIAQAVFALARRRCRSYATAGVTKAAIGLHTALLVVPRSSETWLVRSRVGPNALLVSCARRSGRPPSGMGFSLQCREELIGPTVVRASFESPSRCGNHAAERVLVDLVGSPPQTSVVLLVQCGSSLGLGHDRRHRWVVSRISCTVLVAEGSLQQFGAWTALDAARVDLVWLASGRAVPQ